MTDHQFMKPEELSALIRKPVGTLCQWRHRGYGPPFFRVGRSVLYPRAEAEKWISEQMQDAAGTPRAGARGRRSA